VITWIAGKPRSGKTFFAVKKLNDILYEKEVSYSYVFTNVGGLKYDKLNDIASEQNKNLLYRPLKFSKLYIHLKALYKIAVIDELDDEYLLDYCFDHDLNNALIVIDEFHNFFNKQDKILIWWLTYHGHLFQDIFLITQNKALVASCYRQIPEYFTKALPASHRVQADSLRYEEYSDYANSKAELIRSFSLKTDPKIFNLYKSGDVKKPKLFLWKKILGFAFTILIVIGLFYGMLQYFSPDLPEEPGPTQETQKENTTLQRTNYQDDDNEFFGEKFKILRVYCDDEDCIYRLDGQRGSYPFGYFESVINTIDCTILYEQQVLATQDKIYSDRLIYLKISLKDLVGYLPDFNLFNRNYNSMQKMQDNPKNEETNKDEDFEI